MSSVLQPARVLVDPVDGVPSAVEAGRFGLPMVALMAAVCSHAVAWFFRWDATQMVVGNLVMSGDLAKSTEVEIADAIHQAERLALVGGLAKGIFLMPLFILLFAVAVKLTGWLIGKSIAFGKAFTAVAIGLLPIAVYHLVFAVVTLGQHAVTEGMRESLVPSSLAQIVQGVGPELTRVLSAVDFFNLWAAVLIGLGFAEGTGMRRSRGVVVGLVLYVLFAGVFIIGLPGMAAGRGGP